MINEEHPKTFASINSTRVQNTTIFKYLGCNIKYDELSTEDSGQKRRIDTAQCKFYELGKKHAELQNHALYTRENHKCLRA